MWSAARPDTAVSTALLLAPSVMRIGAEGLRAASFWTSVGESRLATMTTLVSAIASRTFAPAAITWPAFSWRT